MARSLKDGISRTIAKLRATGGRKVTDPQAGAGDGRAAGNTWQQRYMHQAGQTLRRGRGLKTKNSSREHARKHRQEIGQKNETASRFHPARNPGRPDHHGLLIAMVAPRLAGISGDAVDTVYDSNQNRMVSMMSGYFEKTNRFPNKLTNLVEEIGANTYQLPAVSDDDPDNGPETLASEFMGRNHFRMHYLNAPAEGGTENLGKSSAFLI